MGNYHLNAKGEAKLCKATTGKCPFGESNEHYSSKDLAVDAYENTQKSNTVPEVVHKDSKDNSVKSTIQLSSAFGDVTVANGDLSSQDARVALTTGLCGNLALAIHDLTGNDIYFVIKDDDLDAKKFEKEFSENPEMIFDVAAHALVASNSNSKNFIDAYGHKSTKEIESFYNEYENNVNIIKGNRAMAQYYSSSEYDLSEFAKAAGALDKDKKGYEYEHIEG